ncbi:Dihydroorotate dehydrogenase electron transfer subunit [Lachnospiraceae bacterium TWA4]|nr:Dihydroorotate dehydrogenase electron transfer subunit [Lachnospiraceae bacterium TWA4]
MTKVKETAKVLSQETLATGIYSLWIETKEVAKLAKPGQFISVYSKDGARLLPRPISICEIGEDKLRIVYRVVGAGTKEFATYKAGDSIEILGPLGNGFPLDDDKKAFLIGGGIGIPPMLELTKQLKGEKIVVLGYRDHQLFLKDEFEKAGATVVVATEDGSVGTKGTVLDAIAANGLEAPVLYSCGPTPMLRALKDYALKNDMQAWISMEERMACGIGACLACVCKSKEVDGHTNVHNKRICKEGPVFDAREVEI